jgi:hypothetical protein
MLEIEYAGRQGDHEVYLIMVARQEDVRVAAILGEAGPFLESIRSAPDLLFPTGDGAVRVLSRCFTPEELKFLNLA